MEETILSAVLTPLPHPEPIPVRASFFSLKTQFSAAKIHSVWGIFLSAAKKKKKRRRRKKRKEKSEGGRATIK